MTANKKSVPAGATTTGKGSWAARVERDLAPVVIETARAISLTEGGGRP